MLKKIEISFKYDGTGQGDIDRDAFAGVLTTEIAGDNVIPSVTHGDNTETSNVSVVGDLVSATIFYIATNSGIADWTSFWSTVDTEYDKTTVVKDALTSTANKHDCYHDVGGTGCKNFTYVS